MGKLLLYRPRHQTAQQFADDVRRRARECRGTPADRRALVVYVMRRCEEPRFGRNESLIAELERILDGFLDPEFDETHRADRERGPGRR